METSRDTRADLPPRDEGFYERVNKNAVNLKWWAQKFSEAMVSSLSSHVGPSETRASRFSLLKQWIADTTLLLLKGVTPNMYEAMINTADRVLPIDKHMTFMSAASRAIRDTAAERLVADPTVGRYFQRNVPADKYPHAYEFFQSAPKKLIQVVNSARWGKYGIPPLATGAGNDTIVVSRRNFPLASSQTEKLEKEEPQLARQEDTSDKKATAQEIRADFHLLKPAISNTLEIMSLKFGFPIAVNMPQLFGTAGRTPETDEVDITKIRAGAQNVREGRGLPQISAENLKFRFFWIADDVNKEMEVTDDVSLRDAYKIWLAAEDVKIPFVLCVDDSILVDSWVNERMLAGLTR